MDALATVLLTLEEVDALAIAVARSVDPSARPTDASAASAVVWAHHRQIGQPLCSLSTMLAETANGLRIVPV